MTRNNVVDDDDDGSSEVGGGGEVKIERNKKQVEMQGEVEKFFPPSSPECQVVCLHFYFSFIPCCVPLL